MAIETMQLSDALLQNPSVVEEIVGIPHGFDTDGIATDGIFIMFHRKLDNYPLMMKPDNWASYQNSGEIADGVVVVEGGNILVVAPTEESLYWSSAEVSAGGKTTTDRLTALDDWTGKANTAVQIIHPECSGENYAPGFCSKYSRPNANGQGLTAGKWWLPSLGELMMIYANMKWMAFTLKMEELTEYDFWYADYHELPQCPYDYKMWQYSEAGTVPGIRASVDLDLWFQEEN